MTMKSLASKFNLLTIFLIGITALSTGGFVSWKYQTNASRNFTAHAIETAQMLAKQIEYGVYTENKQALGLALQGIEKNPDIAYLSVYDKNQNKLLRQYYETGTVIPYLSQRDRAETVRPVVSVHDGQTTNNPDHIDIVIPVEMAVAGPVIEFDPDIMPVAPNVRRTEVIGYLQLGFSKQRIVADSRNFLVNVLMVIPATLALGMILTFWQTTRITRPVKKLVLAAQAIAQGDFSKRLQLTSNDEIAELALAFNEMSRKLADYRQEVTEAKDNLEQLVKKRTNDLKRKTEESSALEAASKAKSQFLATMSHEIRSPMNGVLGMTELLLESGLNERQKRLADTAYRSANSLLGIINNILDFSKIEAGKLQLIVGDFDLRRTLEETVEIVAEQANRKGLELILNIPSQHSFIVKGDSERLRQVLVNLLGNAIKFTEHGEVQLKVTEHERRSNAETIFFRFEVCDTGPGIPCEYQAHIFDSFTQQDGTITRRYGGTGLGLTISRQLVELMGGELKLSSPPGQGACFYFTLPFSLSTKTAIKTADIEELQGLRILVIDDNSTNREILSDQLGQWGALVTCAEHGPKALKILRDSATQGIVFRAILLDWHLPYMDGLSLAKVIRADKNIPDAELIMLSSDSISLEENNRNNYGIRFFLNKPVFQDRLLACLLEIFAEPTPKPALPSPQDQSENTRIQARVLVAEDNLINQEVTKGFLEQTGYTVDVVENGRKAVDAAKSRTYDLILMDCHMPELDGFDATKQIRAFEQTRNLPKTPVIALTADMQKSIKDQCREAGMDDHLSKPFTNDQLDQLLSRWLTDNLSPPEEMKHEQIPVEQIDSSEVLDQDIMAQLQSVTDANGRPLFDKAIQLYLHTAPDLAAQVRQALNARSTKDLFKPAHTLKSASANLGASRLADICKKLETVGQTNDHSRLADMEKDFESRYRQVIEELKRLAYGQEHRIAGRGQQAVVSSEVRAKTEAIVLLVDDDPNFRSLSREHLNPAGFKILEAGSGTEALSLIKSETPDLILLDAVMDDMDGFETCQRFRATPALTDVPIIMSTGLGDIDSINKAFEVGASDFIIKPLNYAVLIHHIRFLLRSSKTTAELRNSRQQLSAAQRIARLGYWTWNVETDRFIISTYLAEFFRIYPDKFQGTLAAYLALIVPDDRKKVEDAIYSVMEGKDAIDIEYALSIDGSEPVLVRQETALIRGSAHRIVTGTVQDVTRQKETEKMIQQMAYYDELTGLASRSYYHEQIDHFIKRARRDNESFAFLYLDLDEFKFVNDSFGHNIGDQYLKVIAHRFKSVIREADFAARLGGDEFCILLNNVTGDSQPIEVAERCLKKINQPLILDDNHFNPRVSIGIAMFPKDGENEHDLMKAADAAMYSAKKAGKQCYAYYRPEMTALAMKRLQDEHLLREAVETNQFVLYYQPQINMQTGRIEGLEALIRWQHPIHGLVSPFEFITLAENLGLIDKIGVWVLGEACRQMMAYQTQGHDLVKIAVNISPIHFRDPALIGSVREALRESRLPPDFLQLEVTESVMQTQGDLKIFAQLKKLGVKIAIDDFGTGYSSLASLKELPVDCLKIDRVFVQDVLYNPQTPVLLGTIIGLANAMDYSIVAEGVETFEQAMVMSGLGCQIIQGYFFSKPVSAQQLPALFGTNFIADL